MTGQRGAEWWQSQLACFIHWDKVQNCFRVKEVECVKSSGDADMADVEGGRMVSGGNETGSRMRVLLLTCWVTPPGPQFPQIPNT